MKCAYSLLFLALVVGCKESIRDPKNYLRAVLEHPVLLKDGPFEYKVNQLPVDYFLARELMLADSATPLDMSGLKRTVDAQNGAARYFLLRIGLDSSSAGNPVFQEAIARRMRFLQVQQELARSEINGISKGKKDIHPDLLVVDSDWITKRGVSILFSFKQEDANGLTGIEFGKSFVQSRNLSVDLKRLEPKFRFKG